VIRRKSHLSLTYDYMHLASLAFISLRLDAADLEATI